MILLIDNYDSFTYNLYNYFRQIGIECSVYRNDVITLQQVEQLQPEAIVLSPGPKRPEEAGITLPLIDRFYSRYPILGICLGCQAIGVYWGGKLSQAAVPVHGKTAQVDLQEHPLLDNLPTPLTVMRYHSLVLKELASTPLQVMGATKKGQLPMIIRHNRWPVWGVQYHPESILTEKGLQFLKNWWERIVKPT